MTLFLFIICFAAFWVFALLALSLFLKPDTRHLRGHEHEEDTYLKDNILLAIYVAACGLLFYYMIKLVNL